MSIATSRCGMKGNVKRKLSKRGGISNSSRKKMNLNNVFQKFNQRSDKSNCASGECFEDNWSFMLVMYIRKIKGQWLKFMYLCANWKFYLYWKREREREKKVGTHNTLYINYKGWITVVYLMWNSPKQFLLEVKLTVFNILCNTMDTSFPHIRFYHSGL